MQAAFVSQQDTNGASEFDRILSSIAGGIGDYLGRPKPTVAVVPPAPTPAPAASTSDFWMLLLIAGGVYLLVR